MLKRKQIRASTSHIDHDELIKRVRIVVIDDHPDNFPHEILKSHGYAIDMFDDVPDLRRLEQGFYDIIILDIGGVGAELSKEEGLGVLQHLKQKNPNQIVIAHSGQTYEPDKIPFFRLADDFMPKPTSVLQWKLKLDDIVASQISPLHYWKNIRQALVLSGVSEKRAAKLEHEIAKSIEGNIKPDIEAMVKRCIGHVENGIAIAAMLDRMFMLFGG